MYFLSIYVILPDMKLIVGLGNPEQKYNATRHNVGFAILDSYAHNEGVAFQQKNKFRAWIAELETDHERVLLVKPATYYNLSGGTVRALADFYKITPSDTLIVHDELALPFGSLRTRVGGSDAGNNGVKSITEHIGGDTARLRIGIKNEHYGNTDDATFVLGTFSKQEAEQFEDITQKAIDCIDGFIHDSFPITTV